jgi:biopolymer transport protein ExbB
MRALTWVVAFALAAAGTAQQGQPVEAAMTKLSRSAEQDLAKSVQELSQLRAEIEKDKLPLAEELTGLEEKVAKLRQKAEKVARAVDEGNLANANLTTEMKAHQTDLDYVAGLLNEYARAFEGKVNFSELQQYQATVDAAKQAVENPAWSTEEKFQKQLALVDGSLARLHEAVGGMRFPGQGVDTQGTVVDGQFAVFGPVAVFSARNGTAGIAVSQISSTRPLIRPLEEDMQAGIISIVNSGDGLLPLDPTRGGALAALVAKFSLIGIFEKGGPIMWPLLIASVIAIATVLERLLFLLNEGRKRNAKARERLFAAVEAGKIDAAVQVGNESRDFVVRALSYALAHRGTSLPSALLYAQGKELKRFRRGIPILDTVITLAPLLGLLGTVTGMMGSFKMISGDLSSPGAITGGISEALIATAFGLGIAITSLLPFNWLNARTDDARHELESASTQLELLLQGHTPPVTAVEETEPQLAVAE